LETVRTPPALALKAGDEERAFARLRSPLPGLVAVTMSAAATALPPVAGLPLFGYGAAGRFPPVLWWAWPTGALLAVAVNLADSLPDVERDRATGVQGLAVRLGVRRAALLAGASYAGALVVALVSGLAAGDRPVVVAGAAVAAVLGVVAAPRLVASDPAGRRVAYRLLLAGMVALALGWAAGVRP